MIEPMVTNQPLVNRRLLTATILGVLAGIGPLCTDLYLPALPQVATAFQAGAAQAQLSLTATLLGIALGQVFIGPISDVRGRKIPLLVSLFIFIAASFLCAAATSMTTFIIFRFVQGLAGAGGIVLSRAVACDLYSGTDLTKFFSLLMLINGIAPIFSPVIGGQILKWVDWTGIFFFLGICGTAIIAAVSWGLEESLPKSQRNAGGIKPTFKVFGELLANRKFMGYALIHSLVIGGMFGYIAASPFVLQTIYGLSPAAFSLCFAANGIGIMIAAQLTGKFSPRYGEKAILHFGLILSLCASIIVLLASAIKATAVGWILLPLFLVVSCVGITTTTSFSLAIQTQLGCAGSASGLIGVISFLFGAVASPLVGLGGGSTALPMGIVLLSANLAALLSYLAIRKNPTR